MSADCLFFRPPAERILEIGSWSRDPIPDRQLRRDDHPDFDLLETFDRADCFGSSLALDFS